MQHCWHALDCLCNKSAAAIKKFISQDFCFYNGPIILDKKRQWDSVEIRNEKKARADNSPTVINFSKWLLWSKWWNRPPYSGNMRKKQRLGSDWTWAGSQIKQCLGLFRTMFQKVKVKTLVCDTQTKTTSTLLRIN